MKMTTTLIWAFGLAAFLAEPSAIASEIENENAPGGDPDAGPEADAAPDAAPEAQLEINEPKPEPTFEPPASPIATEKRLIYSKGNQELAASLAMAGSGDYFYFGAGASFDYFVADRFAPGLTVQYTHIFLNRDFGYNEPHTLTFLPFLKFVITQSGSIAPYLMAAGGYQLEWGSEYAVNAWVAGGGAGVNVAISEHVGINIQLLGLYYWYDAKRIYGYSDDRIYQASNGTEYVCPSAAECDYDTGIFAYKTEDGQFEPCHEIDGEDVCLYQTVYRCDENGENCIPPYSDPSDKSREMFFPLITFGISIFF